MERNISTRWSANSMKILLDSIIEIVKDSPHKFEKPVANVFYNGIKAKNKNFDQFTWKAMRDKMRYLKGKYKAAVDFRHRTDQGVDPLSGEVSVEEYISRICPFFDELDIIFGSMEYTNAHTMFDSEKSGLVECVYDGNVKVEKDEESDEGEVEKEQESDHSFNTFQNMLKTKKKFKKNAVDYLIAMKEENERNREDKLQKEQFRAEEHYKLELKKIKLQEEVAKHKLQNDCKKIALKEKRLDLEEKKILLRNELKNKELDVSKQLEKYKIDKEFEMKKLEIELKYKSKFKE